LSIKQILIIVNWGDILDIGASRWVRSRIPSRSVQAIDSDMLGNGTVIYHTVDFGLKGGTIISGEANG